MRLVDLTHFAGRVVDRILPRAARPHLEAVKRRLPLRLDLAAPVIQAYVNDAHTRSYVGIHNFYSVLLPQVQTDADAECVFRDRRGEVVLRHRRSLPHGGAAMIDIARLLATRGVESTLGTVTVELVPRHPRRAAYRELGLVTSHFFVHFEDDRGSVGQIHPLSTADVSNPPGGRFVSSQLVTATGLHSLEAVQYNATRQRRVVRHSLIRPDTGAEVTSASLSIAPLGAAISHFPAESFAGIGVLGFVVDDLPAPNAKPVLRRMYASGLYSMSHA